LVWLLLYAHRHGPGQGWYTKVPGPKGHKTPSFSLKSVVFTSTPFENVSI
jgi:hypothetical protein